MISGQQEGVAEVSGIDGIQTMGMKVTGKSFGLLIDKLYTRKEDAVVREIGSNARDAMVMVGKADQPFHIHLPSDISHELIFQDFGPGLSVDDVHKYLGNLFESSKDNENQSIGSYGLGSKSPFCVTDSYAIESIQDGQKHFFSFFRAKGSTPKLVHLSSSPTEDPNGIIFRIPVPPARYGKYLDSIRSQMMLFSPRPKVFSLGQEIVDVWSSVEIWKNPYADFMIVENNSFHSMYGSAAACMGGVLYPLQLTALEVDSEEAAEYGYTPSEISDFQTMRMRYSTLTSAHGSTMVFNFNIGDLEIPPARESIEYDTRSSINVLKVIDVILKATAENTIKLLKEVAEETSGMPHKDVLARVRSVLNAKEFDDAHRSSYKTGIYDAIKNTDQVKFRVCYDGQKAPKVPYPITVGRDEGLEYYDGYSTVSLLALLKESSPVNLRMPLVGTEVTFTDRYSVADGYTGPGMVPPEDKIQNLIRVAKNRGSTIDIKLVSMTITPTITLDRTTEPNNPDDVVQISKKGYTITGNFVGVNYDFKYRVSSSCIRPGSDRVSPIQAPFKIMDGIQIREDRRFMRQTTLILIDEENDIYKKAGWLMKCDAAGTTHKGGGPLSDDDINVHQASRSERNYYMVRSAKNNFDEIEEMLTGHPFYKIVRISEVPLPKLTKSVSMEIVRGLRYLNTLNGYDGNYSFRRGSRFNQFTMVKPPASGTLDKHFFVYGDGETESVYLDSALKKKVTIGEVSVLVDLYYKFSKDKMATGVYRLSPSLAKKKDKFLEIGCIELEGAIASSLKPSKFRNKLKRQYNRFLLGNAHNKESEIEVGGITVTKLMRHFPDLKHFLPNMCKMLMENHKRSLAPNIANWQLNYKRHYGQLSREEAMAMAIVGFNEFDTNEREDAIKFFPRDFKEMIKKVDRTVKAKFMEYFRAHPVQILNSGIDRNSDIFDCAVEAAKKALKRV